MNSRDYLEALRCCALNKADFWEKKTNIYKKQITNKYLFHHIERVSDHFWSVCTVAKARHQICRILSGIFLSNQFLTDFVQFFCEINSKTSS